MEYDASLPGVTVSEVSLAAGTRFERAMDAALSLGRPVFALANIALGTEMLVCAHSSFYSLDLFPLPAIPWLAYLFGLVWVTCSVGLLFRSTGLPSKRMALTGLAAALALGSLLFVGTLIIEVPRYAAKLSDMGLRTVVFEPLALATLAWLLPDTTPSWLARASRYLLALSLVVFGVDHFLALAPIGTLIPNWIPWHVFWIAFFGAGFIAAGVSIGFNLWQRWGAACVGLMFAIWVLTLHLPRVFGHYGGKPHNPDEWSSLFIAIALWGGSWALARRARSDLVAGNKAVSSAS